MAHDRGTSWLRRFADLASKPDDSDETRSKKQILMVAALFVPALLLMIGGLYVGFNEPTIGWLFIMVALYTWVNAFLMARVHGSYRIFIWALGIPVLPIHLLVTLDLGSFVNSGGVILWGLAFPVVISLLFIPLRQTSIFFVGFLANVVITTALQPYARETVNLPTWVVQLIFATNMIAISSLIIGIVAFFIKQRELAFRLLKGEQVKAENLLLNILPEEIASILKNENRTIAEHFDGASILFADVVNFTPISATMTPVQLVELLNEIFSHFDVLVESYGLEKIKTIGDCYMVASGVPRPRNDHAQALVRMALEMQDYVARTAFQGQMLNFRIGINSGPVVAGVIGRKKFIYDLWGDAVNTASRMESHGKGGSIQITESTYDLIKADFACEPQGVVNVKGKGEMKVWHVVGENQRHPQRTAISA